MVAEKKRGGRRALLALGIALLLLVAAFFVVDLVLRNAAEDRLAGEVQGALEVEGEADVRIGGARPLIFQVASGRLDDVTVTADRAVLEQGAVTDVVVRAHGVTVQRPYTASDMTVTGTVPTEEVRARIAARGLDLDLAVAGDAMRASGEVLTVPWGVSLEPRVDGGRLLVDIASADVAGFEVAAELLPRPVRDALTGLEVPVEGLPAGLTVTDAGVVAGGLAVTLTGQDVVFPT